MIAATAALLCAALPAAAHAADAPSGDNKDKTIQAEDEDFSNTPFTEYGEFNEQEEEEADTQFLQHGRLFGAGLGIGYEGVSGNRGLLWQGGFPYIDFKVHYWFDFHFAIDLDVSTATHFYNSATIAPTGHTDVNLLHGGIDLRYYFDTKNAPAPISFSNPFLLIGGGVWSKTQNNAASGNPPDQDVGFGVGAGAGLQFALIQRKCYFEVEGKVNYAQFKDTGLSTFASVGIPDLTGLFFTISGNILFTW